MEEKYLKDILEIKRKYIDEDGYIDKRDIFHQEMDNILLGIVNELGYKKIVKEYIEAKEYFYYI